MIDETAVCTPEQELLALAIDYVRKWQLRLHLADWLIDVRIGPVEDEHGCEVSTLWRNRAAVITFPPDFLTKMQSTAKFDKTRTLDDLLEHSTVHELLHVVEYPIIGQYEDDIRGWIGQRGDSIANQETWKHWRDYREWWVNHVARVLIEADRSGGWAA